jgi:hypothetical protein
MSVLALKALQISQYPFKNLPEKRASRWGESLTVEKMDQCRWVEPNRLRRLRGDGSKRKCRTNGEGGDVFHEH